MYLVENKFRLIFKNINILFDQHIPIYGLNTKIYFPRNISMIKFNYTSTRKMKFLIKDFFSKCDQICRKLRIWSHLLKKSFIEIFIFVQWIFLSLTWIFSKTFPKIVFNAKSLDL